MPFNGRKSTALQYRLYTIYLCGTIDFTQSIMERWELVRQRVQQYLGERKTSKDRAYSKRRRDLAKELAMKDVTLKGFLLTPQNLGWMKLGKLLAMPDFQDLRNQFPELEELKTVQVSVFGEIQLELNFDGFEITPALRIVRLPVGREGKLRLTIQKIS
jgi:hypothetical protein